MTSWGSLEGLFDADRLKAGLPRIYATQARDDLAVIGDESPCADDFLNLRHHAVNVHRLGREPTAGHPEADKLREARLSGFGWGTCLEPTVPLQQGDAVDLNRRRPSQGAAVGHHLSISDGPEMRDIARTLSGDTRGCVLFRRQDASVRILTTRYTRSR